LNRAKKRLEEGSRTQNSPLLFSIKEGKRLYKVDFETIFLIQAFGDYVRIHTAEKVYITKSKFIHIKAELPHYFLQVHRSYIINLNFLKYVEGNHLLVHKEKIPISNTYREELMKVL
jgi:DNA-binding LytR/AlgR family response regulator